MCNHRSAEEDRLRRGLSERNNDLLAATEALAQAEYERTRHRAWRNR
jgi:hypothetical protein